MTTFISSYVIFNPALESRSSCTRIPRAAIYLFPSAALCSSCLGELSAPSSTLLTPVSLPLPVLPLLPLPRHHAESQRPPCTPHSTTPHYIILRSTVRHSTVTPPFSIVFYFYPPQPQGRMDGSSPRASLCSRSPLTSRDQEAERKRYSGHARSAQDWAPMSLSRHPSPFLPSPPIPCSP